MAAMVDPHPAYLSFRERVKQGFLHLEPCKLYPEIKLHADVAEGQKRLTYTILDGNTAKGILQLAVNGWDEDVLYVQLGIAVGEEFRNQGVGYELNKKGLEEFLHRFRLPAGKKLGIEAIISKSNIASQKLAAKIFPNPPSEVIDKYSGEEALCYEFIVIGKST